LEAGLLPSNINVLIFNHLVSAQTIAILQRLLSTQTDNDQARRERLLKLLADEEAKGIVSSQHDVSPRSAIMNPR
jgi:hypothetical protein